MTTADRDTQHPITRYRQALGLGPSHFGMLAGVGDKAVLGWELGRLPRPRRLQRLAHALSVDPAQLEAELLAWRARRPEAKATIRDLTHE